jgi:hypothetical protein
MSPLSEATAKKYDGLRRIQASLKDNHATYSMYPAACNIQRDVLSMGDRWSER